MGLLDIVKKGISFIPGAGPIAATALDVGEGLFKHRGEVASGKEQRRAAIAGGKLKQNVAEDTRLAHTGLGAGMAPELASRGFVMPSAEVLAQLGARRNYDKQIEEAALDPTKGAGNAFVSGLFGLGGDIAAQYGMGQDQADPLSDTGITVSSPVPDVGPGVPGYKPFNPALGGGSTYNMFDFVPPEDQ